MTGLQRIIDFLDSYLLIRDIKDTSWNGLQVRGKEEVKKIICAVDAGIDTFNIAIQEKADLVIVHHGHFWKTMDPSLNSWKKERIDLLYKNGISLYAAHLPLDRHKEVGNNAQLIKLLGGRIEDEFVLEEGKNIGWTGRFRGTKTLNDIENALNSKLHTQCITLPFGPSEIRTIAVCSGGGDYKTFHEAMAIGVNLYITGDASEVYHTAKDAGMNVIFAGHHATETLGVQALVPVLKKKFRVEVEFVDIPTGL